jgi:hypothetical protein
MLESIGNIIKRDPYFSRLLGEIREKGLPVNREVLERMGANMAEDRIQQNDEVEIGLGVPEPDDFETLNQNEADDYRGDDETIELPDDEL